MENSYKKIQTLASSSQNLSTEILNSRPSIIQYSNNEDKNEYLLSNNKIIKAYFLKKIYILS